MLKRILVPLDGSRRAERAIPIAARLAHATGGSIILVQALSITHELYTIPAPTLTDRIINMELAEAEKRLAGISASGVLEGIPAEIVTLFGTAASTILSVAHSHHADLIVLCSHGYTGMTRWVMGSVAEKVVRYSPVPVLLLREGGPILAGPHPDATRPLRALVSLDGSALAKAALEPAAYLIAGLAAPEQGALHITRVVKPLTREESLQLLDLTAPENSLRKAKKYLISTAEHIREGRVAPAIANLRLPVTWSVAVNKDVAEALIRVAENGEDADGAGVFGGCDVIAIATHGYSGLQRWATRSIMERILHATKLPLLIVRPPDVTDKSHVAWGETAVAVI